LLMFLFSESNLISSTLFFCCASLVKIEKKEIKKHDS